MTRFLEIARQQSPVQGICAVSALSRLSEALLALGCTTTALASATVHYTLQSLPPRMFGEQRLPMLSLQVSTTLPLLCQRCFEAMPQAIDLTLTFAVCDTPSEALLDEDEIDWLETNDALSVEMLVEDEVLMALPIAVRHEQACAPVQLSAGEKPNPFAVLKQLKRESE